MNALFALGFELRLLVVFVVGVIAAGVVNWAVYEFRLEPRPLSPWCRRHPHDDRSRWLDRLPIVGWLCLMRKGKQLGYEFWVRPLVVEVVTGLLLAALYWWEVEGQRLIFPPAQFGRAFQPQLIAILHAQFAAHAVLVLLMLAASLIDADEQIIPDEITVIGTLVALVLMTLLPSARLPGEITLFPQEAIVPLQLASPQPLPAALEGQPQPWSLALALACYLLWCVALLPRTWRTRRGYRRAVSLLLARVAREPASKIILAIAIGGGLGIGYGWHLGGQRWESLLSSLVGVAAGGGLVWGVRVIGGAALGREAMGFGDVTLLAMIGAFLGWQPAIMTFFLAPIAGLVLGVIQFAIKRDNVLPFGPFLCLAASFVIVRWGWLWDRVDPMFRPGWLAPAGIGVCLASIGVLLGAWRGIKSLLGPAS